jgi:hypothetical protein
VETAFSVGLLLVRETRSIAKDSSTKLFEKRWQSLAKETNGGS